MSKFYDYKSDSEVSFDSSLKTIDDEWTNVFKELVFQPVEYTYLINKYQNEYFKDLYINLSSVIYLKNNPVGIWPINLDINNKQVKTYYRYLLPPLLNKNLDKESKLKIFNECCLYLISLIKKLGVKEINIVNETYHKSDKLFFEIISKYFEYKTSDDQTLLIDLCLSISEIKKNFRKSFKSIVNPEKLDHNLKINFLDNKNYNDSIWEQFCQLHFQVAKRKTRSQKTWDIQCETIKKGISKLIYITEKKTGKLISGSLYHYTRDDLIYSSNASLTEYRKYYLGHKTQFYSINLFKKKKIKYYYLSYDNDSNDFEGIKINEKFKQVLNFKSGFGKTKKLRKIYYLTKKSWT